MIRRALSLSLLLVACDKKEDASPSASTPASDVADPMTEYLRKSKSAEAKVNLRGIARGVQFASEEERVGLDGTVQRAKIVAAPVTPPIGECCKQAGKKCAGQTGDWKQPGWQAIAFELADPHYYSYELVVDATGFTARAIGDLDCDGELATYELRGTSKPDGTYEIAPELTEQNPLE